LILSYIILGLLMSQPMTGYDLKSFFNKSINFFWSAKLSQIYRELSNLEKKGLIRHTIEHQEGRPDKKIYSVTKEGELLFLDWLKDFPQNLTPVSRNEFLVRIFFSYMIPNDELIFQFRRYIREKEEELKEYRGIEERMNNEMKKDNYNRELFNKRLTVRRGIHFAESEIKWAKECIEELRKFNLEVKK